MSGYTPGPWYVRDFRATEMARLGWVGPSIDRILIVNKTGAEIVESAGDNCVVARIQFDNRTEGLGEGNIADARLIAAAPALVEALQEAREVLAMMVEPDAIQNHSVGAAWQAAVAAELKARRAIDLALNPTQGEVK